MKKKIHGLEPHPSIVSYNHIPTSMKSFLVLLFSFSVRYLEFTWWKVCELNCLNFLYNLIGLGHYHSEFC